MMKCYNCRMLSRFWTHRWCNGKLHISKFQKTNPELQF